MLKIILLLAFLLVAGTIWFFYFKIKRFARQNFGTDSLQDLIETQEEQLANTPKSVSGMTSLYLPRLQEDFPELNWIELRSKGEQDLLQYLKEHQLQNPVIHQTELRDYRKNAGTCYVILQSSVQYEKDGRKIQTRYNTTLSYIQDASKTKQNTAYSTNCPNCGAPISKLGTKICEYCGSEVISVNMHVWALDQIKQC